jgi:DNA repair exonuclease SbcCD ATPase subunit
MINLNSYINKMDIYILLLAMDKMLDKRFDELNKRLDKNFEKMDKMIKKFDKKFDEKNEKISKNDKKSEEVNEKLEEMIKKLEEMNEKLEEVNEKFDKKLESLESEMKILKLTQDYINETGNYQLQKPLDSVSLDTFLSNEIEENSYFRLFR